MNSVARDVPVSLKHAQIQGACRQLLLNDEGNSALHYLDADAPQRSFTHQGPGRDLQLIGKQRVLRSHPQGYVELDLERRGALAREAFILGLPGTVESARRLPSGNTVVAGNGQGGSFIWELDADNRALPDRRLSFLGIEKVRLVRQTAAGTMLFCSEKAGKNFVHEVAWQSAVHTLFEVPSGVPADSMVKAVRVSPSVITVSTGYAASLLRVDTDAHQVLLTIGGKAHSDSPDLDRPLSPFFFSGYQTMSNGEYLIANWQGHSAGKNRQGYQLLQYDAQGKLIWAFDQTEYPQLSSINNVLAIGGLDTEQLHDEPSGVLVPC